MDHSRFLSGGARRLASESRLVRVLRYPDFRLLWIGTFLSFTGSQVQTIAQGYFVYQMTHNTFKLAVVTFAGSVPVFLFGLFTGSISDRVDKRMVLIWTQVIFAINAIYLAVATYFHFIQYWQIVFIALLSGLVSAVEMPTRQGIVSRVVPREELAAAVPINAMTFNGARILGPVIGAFVLTKMGVAACYAVNGLSFLALVWSGFVIRSDLKPLPEERGPLKDLVLEGARYTFHDHRLRTLFLLESLTACFGLAYLPLLPAYVADVLGFREEAAQKSALGAVYTAVGIGALLGLLLGVRFADSKHKGRIIQAAMGAMSAGLIVMAFTHNPMIAYVVLGVVGMAAITQLNTTNALFQLLSPARLRGRVLAMHIWALNGLSPFGVLICGHLATQDHPLARVHPLFQFGITLALTFCGACMGIGTIAALLSKRGLSRLYHEEEKTVEPLPS
jgi:MFS family permease